MTDHRSPFDADARLTRALDLLGAYGAARRAWPEDVRALYDAVEADARFQEARAEAQALDSRLGEWPAPEAGHSLQARMIEGFTAAAAKNAGGAALFGGRLSRGFGRLIPAGALAGLTALGFAIGAASAGVSASSSEPALYYADASTAVVYSEDDAFWGEDL